MGFKNAISIFIFRTLYTQIFERPGNALHSSQCVNLLLDIISHILNYVHLGNLLIILLIYVFCLSKIVFRWGKNLKITRIKIFSFLEAAQLLLPWNKVIPRLNAEVRGNDHVFMRKSNYADFLWKKQAYLYADAYTPSLPSLLNL